MNLAPGLRSLKVSNLAEICEEGHIRFDRPDCWYEFGIRWTNNELAQDVLVVETDGYYDGPDQIEFSGQSYCLEFGEDQLNDVLSYNAKVPPEHRPSAEVALRYYIEFDAYLDPNNWLTGGKWAWGGMRGRPEKREPKDFHNSWRIS